MGKRKSKYGPEEVSRFGPILLFKDDTSGLSSEFWFGGNLVVDRIKGKFKYGNADDPPKAIPKVHTRRKAKAKMSHQERKA